MIHHYNANPFGRNVGDCAIRAICAAFCMEWEDAYCRLYLEGYAMRDLPNSNAVWGRYLRQNGFVKCALPDSCMDGYTAGDFARDHPHGVFVLALPNHVVCVRDGEIWDSWDSENEIALYYFEKVE